jgi:drug/metabolite transporter (DMT)-like permease
MGIFLSLLSSLFATSKDLLSKRLALQLDAVVSTFASFAFALPYYTMVLFSLWLLGYDPFEYPAMFFGLVLLRSITDTFAEAMKMYALSYGDISLVACFFSLSPLFLFFISPWITGDPISLIGGVAVGLVVLGSLLVYRPSATKDWASQKKGIALALGAAVFFSLNSCFDRLAMRTGTAESTNFLQTLTTATMGGFAMTFCSACFLAPLFIGRPERQRPLWEYGGEFALRGLLEILFMVGKLAAMSYLQAPYVVGIQRFSLVLAIIGGKVLFGEPDFGRRLIAGLFILAGVLLIVLGPT